MFWTIVLALIFFFYGLPILSSILEEFSGKTILILFVIVILLIIIF